MFGGPLKIRGKKAREKRCAGIAQAFKKGGKEKRDKKP